MIAGAGKSGEIPGHGSHPVVSASPDGFPQRSFPLASFIPMDQIVDIIIPVYRGFAETRRCLESVLGHRQQTPVEIIVIDDAGPEPALTAHLDQLAKAGRITLLRNSRNIGFVGTVNRGMELHPGRDVVLLNSDTEVANDWLDRLMAHFEGQADAGTLTPFSNNATICSYPHEGWTGGIPGTLGLAGLDRLIARTLAGRRLELPTAVGFCMAIRRACLDQVGMFDAERFGRGYGEENDFSRRAAARGWKNLLAADILVFHEGGVSFSAQRQALQEQAMKILLALHPDYLERVQDFLLRDPIAPLRQQIDQARIARSAREEIHVQVERGQLPPHSPLLSPPPDSRSVQLHIGHGWGGGTERWILDFCRTDTLRRNLWLRSCSHRNAAGYRLELLEPAISLEPLLAWDLALPIRATAIDHPEYEGIIDGLIRTFDIQAILVSSLIGHGIEALDRSLPTGMILHDLYPYCPALFAHFDGVCTSCNRARLADCLQHNGYNAFWHNTTADDWLVLRDALGTRLARPELKVFAPTQSVRDRWAVLLPALAAKPWDRIAHGLNSSLFVRKQPPGPAGKRLRIVIPGRLHPHKGLALAHALLPALTPRADVLLLGCGGFGAAFRGLSGLQIVENYALEDLAGHIADFQPDLGLLLSSLPESFSYTLSEMFALGVPVIATAGGALGERIRDGITGLLAPATADAVLAQVARLDADRSLLAALQREVATEPIPTVEEMVAGYHTLLPVSGTAHPAATALVLDTLARQANDRAGLQQRLRALEAGGQREAALSVENTRLRQDLEAQTQTLHEIRRSHSWRATAPIRRLTGMLRRLLAKPAAPSTSSDIQSPAETSPTPAVTPNRQEIRSRVRHWFGIPDSGALILGFGVPESVPAFLACVERISARRNDISFLLAGLDEGHPCWAADFLRAGTLVATRKLFFSPSLFDRDAFLTAADALIFTNPDDLRQHEGAIGKASLPILAVSPASAPGPGWEWMDEAHLAAHLAHPAVPLADRNAHV